MPENPPEEPKPGRPATPAPGAAGPHPAPTADGTATATATVAATATAAAVPSGQPAPPPQTRHWVPPIAAPLHGPWASTSMWGRRWPGPARAATPGTVLAIGVAAAVAALSIPLDQGGIGWLVTAIAGVAALVIARRLPHRQPSGAPAPLVRQSAWPTPRLTTARIGWTVATVALLGVGTVRAAGWLFLLCLATAALTGALAVGGGRSLRAMVAAAAIAPVATLRAVPWAVRGLAGVRGSGRGRDSGVRIAATVAVSVALLTVFGALFASADENFARIVRQAVPDINGYTVTRWVFVGCVSAVLLFGAAFLRAAPPDLSGLESPGTTRVRRLEWAVPLGALVALFATFVAVQLTVLFAGDRHVQGTADLTYADFARGGFWQLLVVTGLTLVVLAAAVRWAPREARADRVLIRVVLGALAVLTLVIVASALHRMDLYADTYGLTRLRLLVALCELWLGTVFVLVLIAGVRLRGGWLPRVAVALGVAALLGLAAANPDALIAERSVARFAETRKLDTFYLSLLSPDAVPALSKLPEPRRTCVLSQIAQGAHWPRDDWRYWNAGREQARRILVDVSAVPRRCPGRYPD